jgi:predicted alpha/beta-fold hydrolase
VGLTAAVLAPEDFPPFRPRPPWLGPDLQTVRNYLRRPVSDLSAFAAERLDFPMADGDRLLGELNVPDDPQTKPLIVLVHGLTGCATGTYMLVSARHLLGQGYPVLRLNLRGAGPTRALCRGQYHAGRTEDFRAVLAALPEALTARGIVAVGYSLGANMLLKYLGEQGAHGPVRAAAAISAPIDLAAASRCIRRPRNRLYHGWLVRRMQEEALAGEGLDDTEREAVRAVRSCTTSTTASWHRATPLPARTTTMPDVRLWASCPRSRYPLWSSTPSTIRGSRVPRTKGSAGPRTGTWCPCCPHRAVMSASTASGRGCPGMIAAWRFS